MPPRAYKPAGVGAPSLHSPLGTWGREDPGPEEGAGPAPPGHDRLATALRCAEGGRHPWILAARHQRSPLHSPPPAHTSDPASASIPQTRPLLGILACGTSIAGPLYPRQAAWK